MTKTADLALTYAHRIALDVQKDNHVQLVTQFDGFVQRWDSFSW